MNKISSLSNILWSFATHPLPLLWIAPEAAKFRCPVKLLPADRHGTYTTSAVVRIRQKRLSGIEPNKQIAFNLHVHTN